ncbi:glycosyltransferase family 4 protein [Mucilaginibacter antarcticus]|uniref:glycosyltransferase family 4 protein n=1 Tax=Mucilaginibacter antarcticus TaxID=1855725 RepID=UPI00363354F5
MVLQTFSITPKNYLLHVGSMFKRKNIPALIEAFSKIKVKYPYLKLVLAGAYPSNKLENAYQHIIETIHARQLSNDVVLTGYLPDSGVEQLYINALLYVFPSINEGFGIPVLEAFSHSLPVLIANNTCLPEIGGEAVLTFNPFDIADITATITSAMDDENLRKSMIEKGRVRLKIFHGTKQPCN